MPKTATATAVSIDTLPERLRQFQRDLRVNALARWREWADTVSYTHLTLPTIYSV